jgi:hypothetical protein
MSYVAGSLKADDFSGFEINFRSDSPEIPILISYRDSDGNLFETTKMLDVSSVESSGEDGDGGSGQILLLVIGLMASGGVVCYWKFFRQKSN